MTYQRELTLTLFPRLFFFSHHHSGVLPGVYGEIRYFGRAFLKVMPPLVTSSWVNYPSKKAFGNMFVTTEVKEGVRGFQDRV